MDRQPKNDKTERARGPGRKTRGDRKEESNDSPGISDRRSTSIIPGLPWGSYDIHGAALLIKGHDPSFDQGHMSGWCAIVLLSETTDRGVIVIITITVVYYYYYYYHH